MSIRVCIHNHNGQWIEMDRACFGFLSYINQWDDGCIEEHSDNFTPDYDCDEEGIDGFESANLKSVDYFETLKPDYLKDLQEAMAGLPQFYGNFTVTAEDYTPSRDSEPRVRVTFNIPLSVPGAGLPMQPPVIAGMMLRNVICYSSQKTSFTKLIKEGVPHPLAFLIAQAYPYRINGLDKTKEGFYRNFGGDETIFPGASRLIDIVSAAKGELGDCWQGRFGDTEQGYGRYGSYGDDDAPQNSRTGVYKVLADLMLVTKGWEKSPRLNRAADLGFGIQEGDRVFIPHKDMVEKFVPMIMEQLK